MESKQIANQLELPVLGKARVAGLAPDLIKRLLRLLHYTGG